MIALALALASVLAASPQSGTVYTAEGGRLRGTVLEAGPGGVSVQLADGSTRKLEASQVTRVDFADGTNWTPPAAAAAAGAAVGATAAAPPAQPTQAATSAAAGPVQTQPSATAMAAAGLGGAAAGSATAPAAAGSSAQLQTAPTASAMAAAGLTGGAAAAATSRPASGAAPMVALPEKLDTAFLAKGGRVRGLVVEETSEAVVMRLVDGTERRFSPGQVTRVDYADGSSAAPPGAPAGKSAR